MVKSSTICLVSAVLLFVVSSDVWGDDGDRQFASASFLVSSAPESAFLYLRGEKGEVVRRQAIVVPQDGTGWKEAGAELLVSDKSSFKEFLVEIRVGGNQAQMSSWKPLSDATGLSSEFRGSVVSLRDALSALAKARDEKAAQVATLQEDADFVGGGVELASLRTKVENQELTNKALEEDDKRLQDALKTVNALPVPFRASTRERDLVQDLSLLADTVSKAKAQLEEERRDAPQSLDELQERIERARRVDVRALERQRAVISGAPLPVESATPSQEVAPVEPEPEGRHFPEEPDRGNLLYEYD